MNRKNLKTESNNTLPIPTREEFHRYASNTLSETDFCTDQPGSPCYHVNKTASAIRWTISYKSYISKLNYE